MVIDGPPDARDTSNNSRPDEGTKSVNALNGSATKEFEGHVAKINRNVAHVTASKDRQRHPKYTDDDDGTKQCLIGATLGNCGCQVCLPNGSLAPAIEGSSKESEDGKDDVDAEGEGVVSPSTPPAEREPIASRRAKAKTRRHLILHDSLCDPDVDCPGCLAKSRDKPHFKGSLNRDDPRFASTVTMDQVSLSSKRAEDGNAEMIEDLGIGGYRYGIVLCKVQEDYWSFKPIRSLDSHEAKHAFREFCGQVGKQTPEAIATLTVYCDAHASLQRIVTDYGISASYSPPGRPQANALVERKIGKAISGIRAYLAQAGLPNCFWPWAGECYAINSNSVPQRGETKSAYEKVTGFQWNHKDGGRNFIFGEKVMFKPAPTVLKDRLDKLDSTLQPGVFLNYYMNWRGEFTGQYIVCPLKDFIGANLHHRSLAKSFKLSVHRTEVCRPVAKPPGTAPMKMDEPEFPLRQRFHFHNCTLEGLEEAKKGEMSEHGNPSLDFDPAEYPPQRGLQV